MTLSVSHSKIKTWRRCRKQYAYKYIEKLEPRKKGRPLYFGSIVHEMIEAFANGDDPKSITKKYRNDTKKLFSSEREEYAQIIDDAETMMEHYFKYYKDSPIKFVAVKGKLAEHEFELEIAPGIVLKGKIDAIAKTPDGSVWIMEHKSHKTLPAEDIRFRDVQTVIYAHVAPQIGIKKVDGVLWDYIRSKMPRVPELTKKGQLSKGKIDTLKSVYEKAIKDNKLNPKDYKEELTALEGSEDNYFKRIFMPLNDSAGKQLIKEMIITAKEIQEKGEKDATRNITNDCSWCSYEKLCMAELVGNDADYLRKTEFKERKNDEKEPLPVDQL